MEINILNRQNTVLNKFIAEIRDRRIQCDSMRFRRNLERIGELMAYEISKRFRYTPRTVETPLGEAEVELYDNEIVIATILRAGLPFHQGFLNYFDDAQNAFVSAYRKSKKDGTFTVKVTSLVTGESVTKTVTGTTTTTLTGKLDLGINNDNALDISEAGVTGTVKSAKVGDTAVTASLDGTTLSVTGLVDSLGQTVYGDKTLSVVIEKADNSLATVNVPVLVATKILKTADDILGWNELSYAADAAGNYWGGYFVLGNDIDMQGKNFRGCYTYSDLYPGDKLKEGFEGFQWLNGNSGGFRGVFDGRGHAISNLTMSKWCDSFLGLLAAQGTIKNIAFTNVTLGGSTSVIALGGCGRIENAYVEIAAYSNGNAVDSTGIFLARDCMGSARLVNCFVKFNCATTVTGGFNGLGKYHLGYGILKNVYAVGEGMTKDTVIRILSNTNAGGDVYGGYADAAAFAAEVTVSAENGWDMDFWTTTADGLPIPKTLNA